MQNKLWKDYCEKALLFLDQVTKPKKGPKYKLLNTQYFFKLISLLKLAGKLAVTA